MPGAPGRTTTLDVFKSGECILSYPSLFGRTTTLDVFKYAVRDFGRHLCGVELQHWMYLNEEEIKQKGNIAMSNYNIGCI